MTDQQKRIYWNRNWQFLKGFEESYLGRQAIGKVQKAEQAELPHTVQEVPLHYFDESLYQGIFTYRKVFRPDADWQGKRVLLTIEAAGHSAWVYLNGELLNEHHCGYTAFQTDLSPALIYGEENVLVVKVDSTESQNIPPFGKVIDYMGKNPRYCNLREQNGKRSMVIKNVETVETAVGILQEIVSL